MILLRFVTYTHRYCHILLYIIAPCDFPLFIDTQALHGQQYKCDGHTTQPMGLLVVELNIIIVVTNYLPYQLA